ncbi:S8 family serine peptidase [Pontibacter silvestris]|uniref:S8 family serine peptidase n=1 Tax=Pontibacter silvestris TaxID=2305183 RepID=A0ABW4WVD5_9BACT|nr:S8 family serine peptidase [Pontibacter silvestris]MCC9136548.1 S8 family serine peptidase [Pontibacter silvestris]
MRRWRLWLVALTLASATTALAQNSNTPIRTDTKALSRIANAAQKDYKANRSKALELAHKHGWVVEKTYTDGSYVSLQGLDTKGLPIYYITYNNARAAATTKTDQLWAGGSLGLSLSGSSSSVAEKIGIWDGGQIRTSHQELKGRVGQKDDASELNDHATHVAGTMVASGVNALAKGMAYGVKKLQAYDFNGDAAEMAEAAKSLLISNHSYGSIAGWRYNSDREGTDKDPFWEWWGDTEISKTEDYKFGYYDETAAKWDQIAYSAPYYLIVKSVGNNRNENGPEAGKSYYQRNSSGKFDLVEKRPANISNNSEYDVISTYGNAKNVLTIGAVSPIPDGYNQASDVSVASFSSFGPTDDGRIKPDLVGNGVSVLSTSSGSDRAYENLSGTSMAAPNVSGSLLLLQEHYSKLNNGSVMRAATLKGLAIHTADEAGDTPGPDYIYGWGLLDAERAASVISNLNSNHLLQERTLQQNETNIVDVVASGKGPLVVTISWTDPEASVIKVGASALNNRTPRLVNDLDVRVSQGSATYMPWMLNPENPTQAATTGDNKLDNVEQVYIADAVPGKKYTIKVQHKGTLTKGPQAYSLLVSGVGGTAFCTSSPASDSGARINKITLGTKTVTLPAGCTTYRDLTNEVFTFEPGQTKPLALELGSCGTDVAKAAKAFIDWNGDGDFDDTGEAVSTTNIINGTSTYTTSITAPTAVLAGNKVRMRVVLQETADAANISACGSYTRGETQDYLVQFEKPQKDVAVTALLPIGVTGCASPVQNVAVTIRNYGTASAANVPVTVAVLENGAEITQLQGTYSSSLAASAQTEFLVNGSFATKAGTTYELKATSGLAGDAVESNNNTSYTFTVSEPAVPPTASAYRCGSDAGYTLTGSGDGSIFWYSSLTSTLPVAAGNQTRIDAQATTKLYAALNEFEATIGPSSKSFATGGGYNQFTPYVLLTANAPMLLESARLYIGHKGKITFTIYDADGAPVSSRTLYVTPTRTTPAEGNQPDDPNDTGAVYYLGLEIPEAGNYNITISYEDGATIFRNNQGVTGYPFGVPNVVSVTGNTATTTSQDYYYYFYDLKVRALGCQSERIEVPIETGTPLVTPVVTRQGQALMSDAAEGNQWYLDNRKIDGATGQTFEPVEDGSYSVVVQKNGCISDMSTPYTYYYRPELRDTGSELVVSPNPSSGHFTLSLETPQPEDIIFEVVDLLGKQLLKDKITQRNGQFEGLIDLSSRASGVYILRVQHGNKMYSKKLVVQH